MAPREQVVLEQFAELGSYLLYLLSPSQYRDLRGNTKVNRYIFMHLKIEKKSREIFRETLQKAFRLD